MVDHAADRNEFMPPPEPAAAQSFGLALLAHALLIAALAWGINWQRQPTTAGVEAELWSSMPQEAAPPPPPPAPAPVVAPPPAPAPTPKVEAPPPPAPKPPDINLEREKQRKLAEQKQREAEEEALKQKKLAAQRAEQLKKQKDDEARKEREQQAQAAKDKAAKDKAAKDKARQQAEAQRLEALRQENLKRMLASAAGGTGSPSATGTAARSSGPSASYAGRIIARVKPNIVFTDEVTGNPSAEVEVRVAPDGTIVGTRLLKSSGTKSWDDAVLRALDRTQVLPRDTDGSVHSPMIIEFRPRG